MGIRYYGWAVRPSEITEARTDAWSVIRRADARHDDPGWTNTYFDKAWWLLQQLFSPDWPVTRKGYALVAGDVSYPNGHHGPHEPFVGIVPQHQVPGIARDVAGVDRSDVRAFCRQLCYHEEKGRRDDENYLSFYLAEAQTITADAAARGHGIVYVIR